MMRSDFGRGVLWKMARAGVKAKSRGLIGKTWGGLELARLVVFLVWWPCEWFTFHGPVAMGREGE